MAQLYFKFGAMGSSKTANALMARFNYEERGQETLMVKPRLDTRDGDHMVSSRIGLTHPCIYFDEMRAMADEELQKYACIIIDEAQFLTKDEVFYLVHLVDDCGIPVLCYGLKVDFRGQLFEGSYYLLAMADKLEEAKTICVSGGTSPTWLEQGYTYLFRSISNSSVSAKQLAKYADSQNLRRIALFTSNSEYGTSGAEEFQEACKDYDIEFVASETMTDGDRDFTGQFAKINASEPDAVFVWCLGDDLGAVTKQLRQSGFDGPILGSESYTLPEILENAGDAANGVAFASQYIVYSDPNDAEDELMKEFLERYIEEFGEPPASDNAFRAYDGVMMIAEAMEAAQADSGEALRDAYNNIDLSLIHISEPTRH